MTLRSYPAGMRCALALAVMLAAAPAAAEPWAQHSDLSRPLVPMADNPDEGPSGDRFAKGYFERLDRLGFACDATDTAGRHVTIDCRNGRGNTIAYRGQFVGAGYLQIQSATVDGRPLSKPALINHQTSVWNGELRSPSH